MVIVLNIGSNHLFIKASLSPTCEIKDYEMISVLITEVDGNLLYVAINIMRIYRTNMVL